MLPKVLLRPAVKTALRQSHAALDSDDKNPKTEESAWLKARMDNALNKVLGDHNADPEDMPWVFRALDLLVWYVDNDSFPRELVREFQEEVEHGRI